MVMNEDVVVLATPEIAGLPYVISGLVAAGGLAAAMSTADGLIIAMANAISHDIYYKMIDPKASVQKRLIVARVLLVVLGSLAAIMASFKLTGILGAVAWAFDFAMSGLFFTCTWCMVEESNSFWCNRRNGFRSCRWKCLPSLGWCSK